MTKPKTNSESEFDYSSIDVMAIGVMAAIAMMIFFFFFLITALALSQPQVGDSIHLEQKKTDFLDDTDEQILLDLYLTSDL